MTEIISPFVWELNFPHVYTQTSISFLKRCKGFYEAKNGDMAAALGVVGECAKPWKLNEIRDRFRNAVLLPVITENKLPEALAKVIGLRVNKKVCAARLMSRKEMTGIERLLYKPVFMGEIVSGEDYILVDDIITQGGTISALRKYVIDNGGRVVAVAALASSAYAGILAPLKESVIKLNEKFDGGNIRGILNSNCVASDLGELTNSEINYLLRFKEACRITEKINNSKISFSNMLCKIAENTAA